MSICYSYSWGWKQCRGLSNRNGKDIDDESEIKSHVLFTLVWGWGFLLAQVLCILKSAEELDRKKKWSAE